MSGLVFYRSEKMFNKRIKEENQKLKEEIKSLKYRNDFLDVLLQKHGHKHNYIVIDKDVMYDAYEDPVYITKNVCDGCGKIVEERK